jgi:hypothetical protein
MSAVGMEHLFCSMAKRVRHLALVLALPNLEKLEVRLETEGSGVMGFMIH